MSRNTTMVTNMRPNKGFRISQISFGFHTLPFSDYGTKTILNLEAVEEKGSKETTYPKLVLSELGF